MDITVQGVNKVDVKSDKDDSKIKGASSKVTMTEDEEPMGKMKKRTHLDVSEISMQELGFMHTQLDNVTAELKNTKESLKNLMTKSDISEFITKTVDSVLKGINDKIKQVIEEEVKEKVKETVTELNNRLDFIVLRMLKSRKG